MKLVIMWESWVSEFCLDLLSHYVGEFGELCLDLVSHYVGEFCLDF